MGTLSKIENFFSGEDKFPWKFSTMAYRGVSGVFFTNESLEKIVRNYAIVGINGEVIGAPVPSFESTRFQGNLNAVETNVKEAKDFTVICAFKAVAETTSQADGIMPFGTYRSFSVDPPTQLNFGVSIYTSKPGIIAAAATRRNLNGTVTSSGVTLNGQTQTNWGIFSLRANDERTILTNHTTGQTVNVAFTIPRAESSGTFNIGSAKNEVVYGGQVDVAATMFADVFMTESELQINVEAIRRYLSVRRQITV